MCTPGSVSLQNRHAFSAPKLFAASGRCSCAYHLSKAARCARSGMVARTMKYVGIYDRLLDGVHERLAALHGVDRDQLRGAGSLRAFVVNGGIADLEPLAGLGDLLRLAVDHEPEFALQHLRLHGAGMIVTAGLEARRNLDQR